jgi:ribulose-bisphosphate carboxylase large chain
VAAGVDALREAWVAAMEGVPLEQHAMRHPALQAALGFWK